MPSLDVFTAEVSGVRKINEVTFCLQRIDQPSLPIISKVLNISGRPTELSSLC